MGELECGPAAKPLRGRTRMSREVSPPTEDSPRGERATRLNGETGRLLALRAPVPRGLSAMALAAFAVLVVRYAWVTEDAYITLRTVDNFVSGWGPTWNVGERVQTFTHPLWMLVLTLFYAVTREAYITTLAVSALCSVLAVWVLGFGVARASVAGFAAIVGLCFARYFIDFSTSGLENPLTHLLLGLFAWVLVTRPVSRGSIFWLAAIGGLISLNRLDATLLYAPALAFAIVRGKRAGVSSRRLVLPLLLAFAPLAAWEVFALIYYGFPFPNTAYAKLGTGIAAWESVAQGLVYLLDTAMRDPATITLLFGAAGVVATTREPVPMALVAGALLYVGYVIWVGGDFMAGRFLTAPLYLSLCAVVVSRIAAPPAWGALLLVVPALLFSVARLGEVVAPPKRKIAPNGVADERHYYMDSLSLAKVTRARPSADGAMLRNGQRFRTRAARSNARLVITSYNVGLTGFGAGPMVHIIDDLALTDPFLARLPAKRQVPWRIGHFPRVKPHRYVESVQTGRCRFGDSRLCTYWRHLRRITEGPIWSSARLLTIVKMNLGMYDHLVNRDSFRSPGLVRVDHARVARRRRWGDPLDDPALVSMSASGLEVRLGRVRHAGRVSVAVSSDDGFEVVFLRGREAVGSRLVEPRYGGGLMVRSMRVPGGAAQEGYDRVRLYPYRGKGPFQLGHVLFGRE